MAVSMRMNFSMLLMLHLFSLFELHFLSVVAHDKPFPSANDGRGFGSHFQWLDLGKGLEVAKTTQKPLMVIIHKTWCNSCKALKPQFAASKEIAELSENFVMVNAGDHEEPSDKKFAPDGEYIPRIIFLSPEGMVRTEFFNEAGNPSYKYFYSDIWSIIATMKKVAQTYKSKIRPTKEL